MKHSDLEALTACPVCGSDQLLKYKKVKDHSISGEVFNLDHCTDCDLVFTNPRPVETEIGRYYDSEEYISHSNTDQGLMAKVYKRVRARTIRQKRFLVEHSLNNDIGRIADYGCGTGEFLAEMNQNGWSCIGFEPDEKARIKAIENHKLDVHEPAKILEMGENSFDVITLWHVLEHVHKLKDTVTHFFSTLEKGGVLFIAVPNRDSWDACHYQEKWAAYDVPRHLYHFNAKSMNLLMQQTGFAFEHAIPMKWDAYYVSLLSEKYKKNPIGPFTAFAVGSWSNLRAGFHRKMYSSLIYQFRKPEK